MSSQTILLEEKRIYENEYQGQRAIDGPLSTIAQELGGRLYLNTAVMSTLWDVPELSTFQPEKILLSSHTFSLFFENVIISRKWKTSNPDRNEGGGD